MIFFTALLAANHLTFMIDAVSWMRKSTQLASGPAKKQLISEFSKALILVMQQMKSDLKLISVDSCEHPSFVTFVQDVISLIRSHGADICVVDDFFLDTSKEYSPSIQDPGLYVSGIKAYSLRLVEGDGKVTHQLFYYLYSSFKQSMLHNKLANEVGTLLKGMKIPGILAFILGKILPGIVRAVFAVNDAFPLLDVYSDALSQLLSKPVLPIQLTRQDFVQAGVLLHTIWGELCRLLSGTQPRLSLPQIHLIRRSISIFSILQLPLQVFLASEFEDVCVDGVVTILQLFSGFAVVAERSLSNIVDGSETFSNQSIDSVTLSTLPIQPVESPSEDNQDIEMFYQNIVNDIRKTWIFTRDTISIQTPGRMRTADSAQQTTGVERPQWDKLELVNGLSTQFRCWNLTWGLQAIQYNNHEAELIY
jgi:hypothetical protein